ncbi:TonB-dependent receptor [Thauera linaloolentis]|nr:TonB-dependent receptor [Thauera linaloolentis]MCM8564426.1 TonB-dependent receptor [Thauera linaloolentis]
MKHTQSRVLRHTAASLRPVPLAMLAMFCSPWLSTPALAQSVLPPVEVTAKPEDGGLGLSRPSSTGSRTGLSARELPASLEQVDADTQRQRGDFGLVEAVTRTTGLTAQGTGGNGGLAFSARGFTGVTSVGVAEDGTRLGVAAGTVNYPSDSWGYERIEVLRGPASIVHGTGTAGATINAVRKQPSREQSVEALVGVGQHGSARLGLGAAGPIGEIASYRVDAYGHTTDGERDLGRAKGGKFMGTLRFDPSSDLRFEVLADISEQKPERYWGTPTLNGRVLSSLRDQNYNVRDSVIRYQDQRLRARAEWKANDWLTVRNEAHYFKADRHWKNIEAYSYDPASGTVARSDYLEITHDLEQKGNRLEAAIKAGAHNAVIGWETSKATFTGGNSSPYRGASTVSAHDPVHGYWDSPDVSAPKFDTDTTQHAFYLEDAWQVGDKWLLLAGIRRDINEVDRRDRTGGTPFDKTLGGTAWRLGLTHHLTSDTSVYGQVSQGHDPVTNILTLNLANSSFKLTTARQVEVGVKQQFGQGLGEWTAAVYRIDKDDIITRHPDTPSISVQGGSQHSKGLELSAAITPTAQWRLEGNFALVSAEFDELIEAGGANRAGNRPANVPRQVANLWAHYRFGDWQASLGGRYVGKRYGNNANTVDLPSYVVADAVLNWQLDSTTTLRLLGRNLTDKLYVTAAYGSQHLLGDGRRVELVADFRF